MAAWILVVERPPLDLTAGLFMAVSTALHMAYFLLLLQGYARGDLSLVYPTAWATGPVLSMTAVVVWLGESFTGLAAGGEGDTVRCLGWAALILAGMAALSLG